MIRPKLRYLPLAKETIKKLNPVIVSQYKSRNRKIAYDPYKGKGNS